MARYMDTKIDLTDAVLVHRESIDTVFTFDERDFSIDYQPSWNRMQGQPSSAELSFVL